MLRLIGIYTDQQQRAAFVEQAAEFGESEIVHVDANAPWWVATLDEAIETAKGETKVLVYLMDLQLLDRRGLADLGDETVKEHVLGQTQRLLLWDGQSYEDAQ